MPTDATPRSAELSVGGLKPGSRKPMRLLFLTSTPLHVRRGSGPFVGIHTLQQALRRLGATVDLIGPRIHLPVYTLERILYNEMLPFRAGRNYDVTVGFDLDGYRLHAVPHVAAIKGV